jgi:hypothetical protein
MGTPTGEQGSCAKANGVCLDDELRIDEEREEKHHDSERNLSLAYVDGKHAIVAYDENDQLWTRASAEKYLSELMTYSDPENGGRATARIRRLPRDYCAVPSSKRHRRHPASQGSPVRD